MGNRMGELLRVVGGENGVLMGGSAVEGRKNEKRKTQFVIPLSASALPYPLLHKEHGFMRRGLRVSPAAASI